MTIAIDQQNAGLFSAAAYNNKWGQTELTRI